MKCDNISTHVAQRLSTNWHRIASNHNSNTYVHCGKFSYAGLHCVVIKGYSKSAGYQPGMKFEDSRFRNTWNAVYLDGSWRFVQCNWGARHLVNAKDAPANGGRLSGRSDNLRYEYDDHYFMTDPEEFIYEFFPNQPEWQLLRRPIR